MRTRFLCDFTLSFSSRWPLHSTSTNPFTSQLTTPNCILPQGSARYIQSMTIMLWPSITNAPMLSRSHPDVSSLLQSTAEAMPFPHSTSPNGFPIVSQNFTLFCMCLYSLVSLPTPHRHMPPCPFCSRMSHARVFVGWSCGPLSIPL